MNPPQVYSGRPMANELKLKELSLKNSLAPSLGRKISIHLFDSCTFMALGSAATRTVMTYSNADNHLPYCQ